MNTELEHKTAPIAKLLAPEDVSVGDFVAVLSVEHEYPWVSYYFEPPMAGQEEVVRVRLRPCRPCAPMRVEAICLPFIFVRTATGDTQTIDVRAMRLAKLSPKYAKYVRKAMQAKKRKKR